MSYRVKLRPFLLTEGEFKGSLEYIHFHVFFNGVEVGHWSELNQGQIPNSLGQLVGRPEAIECDLELRRGVTVPSYCIVRPATFAKSDEYNQVEFVEALPI